MLIRGQKGFALALCLNAEGFPSQQKCGLSQCLSSRGVFSEHENSHSNTRKPPLRVPKESKPLPQIRVDSRQFVAQKILLWLSVEGFSSQQKCGLSQCPNSVIPVAFDDFICHFYCLHDWTDIVYTDDVSALQHRGSHRRQSSVEPMINGSIFSVVRQGSSYK